MPRKTRRVASTNINFKTTKALKEQTEAALRKHREMDGRMTTFLEDCMRQFVIQMRNKDHIPAYPIEFVTKPAADAPTGPVQK